MNQSVKDIQAKAIYDLVDVEDVGVVILMLPTSDDAEEILLGDGPFQELREGLIAIDMGSSVSVSTQRLARLAGANGIAYVDAPVSGGVSRADSSELTLLLAVHLRLNAPVPTRPASLGLVTSKLYSFCQAA